MSFLKGEIVIKKILCMGLFVMMVVITLIMFLAGDYMVCVLCLLLTSRAAELVWGKKFSIIYIWKRLMSVLVCPFMGHRGNIIGETGCVDKNGENFEELSSLFWCKRCGKQLEVERGKL